MTRESAPVAAQSGNGGGVNRSKVLGVLAAALIVAGIAFGISSVSVAGGSRDVRCGSAFAPSDADAELQNSSESIASALRCASRST